MPPDPETLRQVARISGGRSFAADDADQLSAVYDRLGSQLGKKKENRDIGYLFVGGALIALGLGAGSSLMFFGGWCDAMSLSNPIWLLLLLAIPLVIALQVLLARAGGAGTPCASRPCRR